MDVCGDINAGFISKIMDKSWVTLVSCSEKNNNLQIFCILYQIININFINKSFTLKKKL